MRLRAFWKPRFKYKATLGPYGAGLRVSELVSLKMCDIQDGLGGIRKNCQEPHRATEAVSDSAYHRGGGGRVLAWQAEACLLAAQQSGTTSSGSS
jgi:hypothetical protein